MLSSNEIEKKIEAIKKDMERKLKIVDGLNKHWLNPSFYAVSIVELEKLPENLREEYIKQKQHEYANHDKEEYERQIQEIKDEAKSKIEKINGEHVSEFNQPLIFSKGVKLDNYLLTVLIYAPDGVASPGHTALHIEKPNDSYFFYEVVLGKPSLRVSSPLEDIVDDKIVFDKYSNPNYCDRRYLISKQIAVTKFYYDQVLVFVDKKVSKNEMYDPISNNCINFVNQVLEVAGTGLHTKDLFSVDELLSLNLSQQLFRLIKPFENGDDIYIGKFKI